MSYLNNKKLYCLFVLLTSAYLLEGTADAYLNITNVSCVSSDFHVYDPGDGIGGFDAGEKCTNSNVSIPKGTTLPNVHVNKHYKIGDFGSNQGDCNNYTVETILGMGAQMRVPSGTQINCLQEGSTCTCNPAQ